MSNETISQNCAIDNAQSILSVDATEVVENRRSREAGTGADIQCSEP